MEISNNIIWSVSTIILFSIILVGMYLAKRYHRCWKCKKYTFDYSGFGHYCSSCMTKKKN